MLTIRLARVGKNKRAQFKIVLQEHTVAPGGRHVEILGSYDPHLKKSTFKAEKITAWIAKGAKLSDTVYNLLVSNKIISGEKRKVKMPARIATQSVAGGPAKAVAEAPIAEEKLAEPKKEEIKPEETTKEENKSEVKAEKAKEKKKEEKAGAEVK